jgi:hypothetical protein
MGGVGGIAPTHERVETDVAHLLRLKPAFEARHQPHRHIVLP